jgi:hypothetical protein
VVGVKPGTMLGSGHAGNLKLDFFSPAPKRKYQPTGNGGFANIF